MCQAESWLCAPDLIQKEFISFDIIYFHSIFTQFYCIRKREHNICCQIMYPVMDINVSEADDFTSRLGKLWLCGLATFAERKRETEREGVGRRGISADLSHSLIEWSKRGKKNYIFAFQFQKQLLYIMQRRDEVVFVSALPSGSVSFTEILDKKTIILIYTSRWLTK